MHQIGISGACFVMASPYIYVEVCVKAFRIETVVN